MVSTSVWRFGVIALVVAGLAGCGSDASPAGPAPSQSVSPAPDPAETGDGIYAAPKDLTTLCQPLDYAPFQDLLKPTTVPYSTQPGEHDTPAMKGITCIEAFDGADTATVRSNVLTTIYFYDNVDLARKMYQFELGPAGVEPGSTKPVTGAGTEATRFVSSYNPEDKIVNIVARRSNAVVLVKVVWDPAKDITDIGVEALFKDMTSYADKELTALKTSAPR